jgi:hypothetical protein
MLALPVAWGLGIGDWVCHKLELALSRLLNRLILTPHASFSLSHVLLAARMACDLVRTTSSTSTVTSSHMER